MKMGRFLGIVHFLTGGHMFGAIAVYDITYMRRDVVF